MTRPTNQMECLRNGRKTRSYSLKGASFMGAVSCFLLASLSFYSVDRPAITPLQVVEAAAVQSLPIRNKRSSVSITSLQRDSRIRNNDADHWNIHRGGASSAAASASSPMDLRLGVNVLRALGVAVYVAASNVRENLSLDNIAQSFKDQADNLKFLVAGAVAGIVSRTCVSPLEVVATVQMAQQSAVKIPMMVQLSTLWQQEGMKGFFKGNAANCLKVAPTRAIQFFVFEALKNKLIAFKLEKKQIIADAEAASAAAAMAALSAENGDEESGQVAAAAPVTATLSPLERLMAGGVAGMVASSIVFPLDVVKTLLTLYPQEYPTIGKAFAGCFQQAGIKGFYRGLKPTLLAMFPYVGVEFMIYETSKIALENIMRKRQEKALLAGVDAEDAQSALEKMAPIALPVVISLGLGAFAGACAQSAAHPLDVIRKRLQVQGMGKSTRTLYTGSWDCCTRILNEEGVGALYRGLGPACIATIPGTGIAYITYEFMKKALGLNSV